jgi:hypothetical protein
MNDGFKLAFAAGVIALFGLTACQKAEQEESPPAVAAEPAVEPQTEAAETEIPAELGSGIDFSGYWEAA